MYRVINKELNIASCNLSDLTMQQIVSYSDRCESGAKLDSLTMFYDPESKMLVLNADNSCYANYLKLALSFFKASEEDQEKAVEKAAPILKDTFEFMKEVSEEQRAERDISIAKNMDIEGKHYLVLRRICDNYKEANTDVALAFNYGVMTGKREERARRRS